MRRLPLLLLVLAACGDDSARRISDAPAGPHDSPPLIDTPAQALPVLVSVTFPDGTPVPDVKVYFQNADSSVVGEAPLAANGSARQVMNPGGYATAVVPNVLIAGFGGVASMQYTVATWAGVKPGDHLILTPPAGGGSIQPTITIPLDALHAGVTQYLGAGTLDVVRAEHSSSNTYRNFIEWGTTGAYTTDWSADLLPDFATAPSLDTGTHIISWTTTGGTLTPDFSAATVLANRQLPTPIQWQWGIVAPSGTQLAYPTLPTDIADLNVGADDDYNLFGTPVRIAKVPGGYDAARGAFFSTFEPIPTGATATAAWNDYQQPLTVAAKQKPAKSGVMRRWIRPR